MLVNTAPPAPAAHRVEALDSLRFFAASAVFLSHGEVFLNRPLGLPPLWCALLSPNAAVAFFFVLSGYVLHLSWRGTRPRLPAVASFMVKRWFRIYPLYIASLLLAVAVMSQISLALFPASLCTEEVFSGLLVAKDHSAPAQWLAHLLLIGPKMDLGFLNPPLWTLSVEMRVALIFPWLSWAAAGGGRVWRSLAVLTLSLVGCPWLAQSLLGTLGLVPLFLMGIVLAAHRQRFLTLPGPAAGIALLACGIAIYSTPWYFRNEWSLLTRFYVSGAGAACIIVSVLCWPGLSRVLSAKLLVLGGGVSYGLYILHIPILVATSYAALKWHLPDIVIIGGGAILTLALSLLLYRRLEQPMIALGRSVAARWSV